eukprot:757669-Hanusia_phi.AAC.4
MLSIRGGRKGVTCRSRGRREEARASRGALLVMDVTVRAHTPRRSSATPLDFLPLFSSTVSPRLGQSSLAMVVETKAQEDFGGPNTPSHGHADPNLANAREVEDALPSVTAWESARTACQSKDTCVAPHPPPRNSLLSSISSEPSPARTSLPLPLFLHGLVLTQVVQKGDVPSFGAAADGDADRNMILGESDGEDETGKKEREDGEQEERCSRAEDADSQRAQDQRFSSAPPILWP